MTRASLSFAIGLALLATFLVTDSGAADEGDFIGDSTCIACHEALSKGFRERFGKTVHARAHANAGEPEGRSCESCHGPGRAHFEANGGKGVGGLVDFHGASSKEGNAVCFGCHAAVGDPWPVSVHGSKDLPCSSCHTVMSAVSESGQLKSATQAETCGQCHSIQDLPGEFHQEVGRPGQTECSACHPPHVAKGTPAATTQVGDARCLSCHETLAPGFTEEYHGTVHGKVHTGADAQSCESCHGSGAAHVEAGGGRGVGGMLPFHETSPEAVAAANGACLDCHGGGAWEGWSSSVHGGMGFACSSCHTVMESKSASGQLAAATQAETCGTCHVVADLPGEFHQNVGGEGQKQCSTCHPPHAKPPELELDGPPGYVGDSACLACHETLEPGFTSKYAHTLHARVLNQTNAHDEMAAYGCESCHGPGEAHVRAGGGREVGGLVPFHLDTPKAVSEINETCLGCHRGGERTYWAASVHDSRDLACTSCHTVMESVSDSNLLSAKTEVATCAGCHQVQHARIFRNAHMPLRDGAFQVSTATEGKMSCSSCHQPHGSVSENLITHISVNDQCLSCHAEKRGPFLWEHSPVPENCLNCHDPHGSTRRAMLNMNVIRLCQSCHVTTGHATNPRNPNDRFAVGTSCLQCHTQVHGSNHPSGFSLTR